jgi:hypothetical protein
MVFKRLGGRLSLVRLDIYFFMLTELDKSCYRYCHLKKKSAEFIIEIQPIRRDNLGVA